MIMVLFFTMYQVISGTIIVDNKAKQEENVFHSINDFLLEAVNKTFLALKINTEFFNQSEPILLLSIIDSLNKVSEKKYYAFISVENGSRTDLKFNVYRNDSLFKLDKLLDEVILTDFNVSSHTIDAGFRKSLNYRKDSIELPDMSGEDLTPLINYLKEDVLLLTDIAKPLQTIKKMYEKHRNYKQSRNRNFKLWITKPDTLEMNNRRVYNAAPAKVRKYPFVASIHVKDNFVCTGAILSRDMIVTAASCLVYYQPRYLKIHPQAVAVRVGSDYPDRLGEKLEASHVFIHPTYDTKTLGNNIAIIKIKRHMHIRKKNRKIRRIKYQRRKERLTDSVHEILLLGWGNKDVRYQNRNVKNDQLSYSHLKMLTLSDCVDVYTNKFVSGKNFCAGFNGRGAGACEQDVGGPAVVNNVLVGIVSFGPPVCGTPHAPTVFTKIGRHVHWIDSIVKGRLHTRYKDIPNSLLRASYTTKLVTEKQRSESQLHSSKYGHQNTRSHQLQNNESMRVLSQLLKEIVDEDNVKDEGPSSNPPFWMMPVSRTAKTVIKNGLDTDTISFLKYIAAMNRMTKTKLTTSQMQFKLPMLNDYIESESMLNLSSNRIDESFEMSKFFTSQFSSENTKKVSISTSAPKQNFVETHNQLLSDTDNYESIEYPSLPKPTSETTSNATSNEEEHFNYTPVPIKYMNRNINNRITLIKNFVKDKLTPFSLRLGLFDEGKEFVDKAEKFLVQNYLKELSPETLPSSMANVMSDSVVEDHKLRSADKKNHKKASKAWPLVQQPTKDEINNFYLLLHKYSSKMRTTKKLSGEKTTERNLKNYVDSGYDTNKILKLTKKSNHNDKLGQETKFISNEDSVWSMFEKQLKQMENEVVKKGKIKEHKKVQLSDWEMPLRLEAMRKSRNQKYFPKSFKADFEDKEKYTDCDSSYHWSCEMFLAGKEAALKDGNDHYNNEDSEGDISGNTRSFLDYIDLS